MTYVNYDPEAGVVLLTLREPEGGERGGERIDEWRHRHYDHAGNVCAYEFLFVDRGISLDGIPAGMPRSSARPSSPCGVCPSPRPPPLFLPLPSG